MVRSEPGPVKDGGSGMFQVMGMAWDLEQAEQALREF
jgi:hypothetical protein